MSDGLFCTLAWTVSICSDKRVASERRVSAIRRKTERVAATPDRHGGQRAVRTHVAVARRPERAPGMKRSAGLAYAVVLRLTSSTTTIKMHRSVPRRQVRHSAYVAWRDRFSMQLHHPRQRRRHRSGRRIPHRSGESRAGGVEAVEIRMLFVDGSADGRVGAHLGRSDRVAVRERGILIQPGVEVGEGRDVSDGWTSRPLGP